MSPTRVNKNQHESNMSRNESDTSQHESDTIQHKSTQDLDRIFLKI